MPSFNDVASQLGLPEGPRKLPCLSPDWETSLSSNGRKSLSILMSSLLEEMIERVIRYSTLSATATTQDKTTAVYKDYLALPFHLLSQLMHTQAKTSAGHRRPLPLAAPSAEFAFFS